MTGTTDEAQYRTSDNLSARADIYKKFGAGAAAWHRWVFDHLLGGNLPADARVADIGGGPGWLWQLNCDRIPALWHVMHTDLSSGMVAEARANVARQNSSFEVADAQVLPFADATLDALTANHMLYHVPDLARTIAEFARVLKPRGLLVAATNSVIHMAEIGPIVEAFNAASGENFVWPKLSFTLENGEQILNPFFTDVAVHRRPSGIMQVTDAETLARCIGSIGMHSPASREKLLTHLKGVIAARGVVPIRTQGGLFVARKAL
jgi:ubiquinone/menaquinone biosynthesis C-methylase UbiE